MAKGIPSQDVGGGEDQRSPDDHRSRLSKKKQSGPSSVRVRFGGGTVRAVQVLVPAVRLEKGFFFCVSVQFNTLTSNPCFFSICFVFFSGSPCFFFCAFFLPFPSFLGVPRIEKPLLFSGFPFFFLQKKQGLEGRGRKARFRFRVPEITVPAVQVLHAFGSRKSGSDGFGFRFRFGSSIPIKLRGRGSSFYLLLD